MGDEQIGALPQAARAGRASPEPASSLGHSATIANATNGGPDWYEVAKGLANAIMFNRATRKEHVVGKDGRVRMGIVDLFACYCIDDAAREFCEMAGIPFGDVDVPNEHQAFFMSVTGRSWSDWFTDRDAIVSEAGPSPGRGKVDMNLIAKAMEARQGGNGEAGAVHDSAAREAGLPETPHQRTASESNEDHHND